MALIKSKHNIVVVLNVYYTTMNKLNKHKHAPTLQLRSLYRAMTTCNNKNPVGNYLPLFSLCKNLTSLLQIHAHVMVSGLQNHNSITTHLVKSYISFERLDLSRKTLCFMQNPGVFLYNSVIRAYVTAKNYREAIQLYSFMLNKGLVPDKFTFTFVLKACSGILCFKEGVLVHKDVIFRGLENDPYIGSSLVDMYSKMGELGLARVVFDRLTERDVVVWNSMILGLSRSSNPSDAIALFRNMQSGSVEANLVSILNLIPAVSRLGDIDACKSIHGFGLRRVFESVIATGLIDMYSKCSEIDMARRIFDRMLENDKILWGTMMAGYMHNGYPLDVLDLFDSIKRENVGLDKFSLVCSIMAAGEVGDLDKGKEIHDCAKQLGIDLDVSVATCVVTMYVKCGAVDKAKKLFGELKVRDLVAWSAIIAALVQSGNPVDALLLFRNMQIGSLKPNKVTLVSVLPACSEVLSVILGKSLHCYAIKADFDFDVSVATALVSMYAKCGLFTPALTVFTRIPYKDTITWNALINGYAQIGNAYSAVEMFHKLQVAEVSSDSGTMVGILSACALLNDIGQGSSIHGHIIKRGFACDRHVKIALTDMYAKCRSLSSAEFLFSEPEFLKDKVAWNVMIGGYMHNRHAEKAITAFCQMKLENLQPDVVTFVSIVPAAAYLSSLKQGMTFHACIIRMGFQSSTPIQNCLIDMYSKCGQLEFSERIFHQMKNKEAVSWNAMLAAYANHGQGNLAVELFSLMQDSQIRIDSLSFLSILSACRHSGLIQEGKQIFNSMQRNCNLEPNLEHYACMVDLLGRAGLFDEVLDLIKEMPVKPNAAVWGALLNASSLHSHVVLAEFALDHLNKIEPDNPAHSVSLSNLYFMCGRLEDARSQRFKIIDTGLMKSPGCSWI